MGVFKSKGAQQNRTVVPEYESENSTISCFETSSSGQLKWFEN